MKTKILTNLFFTLIFLLIFGGSGISQTNKYTSPVNWVNYSVESIKVSFLMPKLPVVVNDSTQCRGEQSFSYGSYADGVAYAVRITRKIDIPAFCSEKKEFDKTNFENRVQYLKSLPLLALKERQTNKANEVILENKDEIRKFINDPKNDRWFEFWVVGADENNPQVKTFLNSLKTSKKAGGIEIGNGAERTLGDEVIQKEEVVKKAEVVKKDNDKPVLQGQGSGSGIGDGSGSTVIQKPQTSSDNSNGTAGVRIVLKPRANYTDGARRSQTQGKVTLRVTFSANGGIGSISVISGLADGLTEQAIAAAMRIVFIPAQRNGVHYSVTKPVEYTFTIY
jgi:TonB family protein